MYNEIENQALVKAAEERAQGLATHEPIIITEPSRDNVGIGKRNSSFEKLLTALRAEARNEKEENKLVSAVYKIMFGRGYLECDGKPTTTNFSEFRLPACVEDGEVSKTDLERDYEEWFDKTHSKHKSVCIDVICSGLTFERAAQNVDRSDKTAKKYAVEGVKNYVYLYDRRRHVPVVRSKAQYEIRPPLKVTKTVVVQYD